ncbi:hypothetical protein KGY64_04500 [Candidatus Bipolaricaulota bacterium]|nr:hypothetical protein [Candidatus Bipolaricaulota bacterium]
MLPTPGQAASKFFQWWLTSDQILFRRFLEHEAMINSLGIALGINLWGVFVLYVPINYLIPEAHLQKLRDYLGDKFPGLRSHYRRINDFSDELEGNRYFLFKSKEEREGIISDLVETYEYDYLAVFALSCLPIPFLGTVMTGGALFAIEALEIKFGLMVVILAKIMKVFALAAVAYFAHFM